MIILYLKQKIKSNLLMSLYKIIIDIFLYFIYHKYLKVEVYRNYLIYYIV